MKKNRILALFVLLLILSMLAACSNNPVQDSIVLPTTSKESDTSEAKETSVPLVSSSGQIYLYGERHGVDSILEKELELWHDHYHNDNMRHLFIEYSYYTAGLLNLWMQSEGDDILEEIYQDWAGTAAHVPSVKEFFKKIKEAYPETIFHGTDVGHQYDTAGKRFLDYLRENNLESSEQYLLTQEAIEQGKYFYEHSDAVYRENKMAENFIREFDKLIDQDIMGIYGGAHTGLESMDYTNSVPCMAKQLKELYGNAIHSEDLTLFAQIVEPYRVDTITINGKDYEASYFGEQDLAGFKDYAKREFWRLENAYDDFKDKRKTGNVLPYNNYTMQIETGQVFVIDFTKTDGTVTRVYYRSDGYVWNGMPSTEGFSVK